MQFGTNNTLKILKTLVFFLCFSVCVGSRTFYYPQMCDTNEEMNDCSFQLPFIYTNSCKVYNTLACKNYNFSSWNLKPLFQPTSESESEFIVNISPYMVYVHEIHKGHPISAVNITLTALNEGITGFSIVMTEDIRGRNACRIFDFRNSLSAVSIPFTLYYDCFNDLVEDQWENVTMTFKAYPLNIEVSYFVYITSTPEINFTSACHWQPVVMVFRGSLPKNRIQVKFSKTPESLKITYFILTLLDSSDTEIQTVKIPSTSQSNMISSEFLTIETGYYSVSVGIISPKDTCTVYKTKFFYVGEKIKDYSLIIFIILLLIIIISASVLFYFSCRWYIKSALITSKPTLLFVYSYKRHYHEFLMMYGQYLENHFGVKVNMIYETGGNPKKWLEKKYSESDIIVFVTSSGLQALDQNNFYGEEHPWVGQLADAKVLIDDSYIGKKKICKICFPYSGKHHIPKCLAHQGPFFMLPTDFNKFLCFIFDCPRKLYILSKLFHEEHHKVLSSNIKYEKDEEIKENLRFLVESIPPDSSALKIKKKKESNLYECNIQMKTKTYKSNISDEKNNSITTDKLLKKCDEGNLVFPKQEPDFEDSENDDFMRYCVRKILNSEIKKLETEPS